LVQRPASLCLFFHSREVEVKLTGVLPRGSPDAKPNNFNASVRQGRDGAPLRPPPLSTPWIPARIHGGDHRPAAALGGHRPPRDTGLGQALDRATAIDHTTVEVAHLR